MTMETLRRVMDSALLPVFAIDEDGCYVFQNRAAEDLLGYDQTEIRSKHLTDLVAAPPAWVLSGFAGIKREGHGAGRILYRLKNGGFLETDVNVFVQTLDDGTSVTVSIGHPVPQETRGQ